MKRFLTLVAALCWLSAAASAQVTGPQLTAELLRQLDLPLSSPLNSDAAALAEGARLGIFSDADSWIDGPLTKGLALNLAFRALGLDVELDIADLLVENRTRFSQTQLESVSLLANTLQPKVPDKLANNPDDPLEESDLPLLLNWVNEAKTGLVWDQQVPTDSGTLWLHRQGLGRPPKSWRVSVASFNSPAEAQSALAKYGTLPFKPQLFQLEEYTHIASPALSSASEAKKLSNAVNGSIVIEGDSAPSEALFFVGWSPQIDTGWILSAQQVGKKSLPLTKYWGYTDATVAINGGYFGGGKPIGTLIMNGLPQYLPYSGRSMVGWAGADLTYFGMPDFRVLVKGDGMTLTARALNAPPPPGEISFYAPPLAKAPTENGAYVQTYQSALADGTQITWWAASKGPDLPPQNDVAYEVQWGDEAAQGVQWGLQGGPMLLQNGVPSSKNEGVAAGVANNRHPRTLVGLKEGKQWWIVVDGRNSWHSRGMTLAEAKAWGQNNGFTDLLNLDGGGSSELVYRGRVINNPSDGRERALPYAVLFGGQLQDGDTPMSDPLQSLFNKLN